MTVTELIEALTILAKYMDKGMETSYFMGSDHDIIYFWVEDGKCTEDSEDGKRLIELGFHVYETGYWAKYV